jgi:hypothetical protein
MMAVGIRHIASSPAHGINVSGLNQVVIPKAMNTTTKSPTIPNAGCFNPPCCSIVTIPYSGF